MFRRNLRLRQQYVHQHSIDKEKEKRHSDVLRLKDAIAQKKEIPRDLLKNKKDVELRQVSQYHDENKINEFYKTPLEPQLVITTSRDPSPRLNQFAKEFKIVLPNCEKVNRGNLVLKEMSDLCANNGKTALIVLHEHRGKPDGMIICHLPIGPTFYLGLSDVVLRHDLKNQESMNLPKMKEEYPHLIFHNFLSEIGQNRVVEGLKSMFPVPSNLSKRIISFSNENDVISFRHHTFKTSGDGEKMEVELFEAGPRFDGKIYKIEKGALHMPSVEVEWMFRPYFNKQKKLLA